MTTYRLMDGVAGRPGVGSTGTQPPATVTGYSGNYIAGLVFQSTATTWLQGYWWWVPSNGDTGAVKCALWQQGGVFPGNYGIGTVVAGSVVTSGTLTVGQWNFIALPTPLLLSNTSDTVYVATIGFHTTIGFPDTVHQFGASNPYASGITNGPLFAPPTSTSGGTATGAQQPFSTAGSDPSVTLPTSNNLDDLLWIDVQVTDVAPLNATYRLWPNRPYSVGDGTNSGVSALTDAYQIGPQISVSTTCGLSKIWFYSATTAFSGAAATALPSRCGIWDVNTQQVVPGSDINGVSWKKPDGTAGSAGAGWLYCDYSSANVILQANHPYKVNVWYVGGQTWRTVQNPYWASGGPGSNGLTVGPLSAPNNANASVGQESWHGPNLPWAYPGTYSNPENDWVDVEVLPNPPTIVLVTDYAGIFDSPVITVTASVPDYAGMLDLPGILATLGLTDYAAVVESLSMHATVGVTDYAGIVWSMTLPESANKDKITAIQIASRLQGNSSFSSSIAAGAIWQGNMRQLAADRWTFMYPS